MLVSWGRGVRPGAMVSFWARLCVNCDFRSWYLSLPPLRELFQNFERPFLCVGPPGRPLHIYVLLTFFGALFSTYAPLSNSGRK
jgi:hypothetical protein